MFFFWVKEKILVFLRRYWIFWVKSSSIVGMGLEREGVGVFCR